MAEAGNIEVGILGKPRLGNDAQAIIDVSKEAAGIQLIGVDVKTGDVVATRADQQVELRDLEQFAERPRRKRGEYHPATVDALIAYVTEHQVDGQTTVWVHPSQPTVLAILDDHASDTSAWREHRARLDLGFTDEWKRWVSGDGKLVSQQEFAEHIEESQLDIVKPDAAEVLEIAESFQASTSGRFKQAQRLATGQVHFEWVEEIDAKAGARGEIEIPKQLELLISPFLGEGLCALTALLRYRVRDGELRIGYKLVRPADVIRDALERIRLRLDGEFPRVYLGTPAS